MRLEKILQAHGSSEPFGFKSQPWRDDCTKEIETKIADIDEKATRAALRRRRARFLGRFLQRRYVFDIKPRSNGETEFLRLRTYGRKTTLTYKHRSGGGFRNTEELEVEIGEFDKAAKILSRIWDKSKVYYQENHVEEWSYKRTEVKISKWPGIKPFIEIEGMSVSSIRKAIGELGIKGKVLGNVDIDRVYAYYGSKWKGSTGIGFKKPLNT